MRRLAPQTVNQRSRNCSCNSAASRCDTARVAPTCAARYSTPPRASTTQVYLAFENVTDEDYELRKGYPNLRGAGPVGLYFRNGQVGTLRRVALEIFPDAVVEEGYRTMASEDMAYLMGEIPGCYCLIGSANPEEGLNAKHHQPEFRALDR